MRLRLTLLALVVAAAVPASAGAATVVFGSPLAVTPQQNLANCAFRYQVVDSSGFYQAQFDPSGSCTWRQAGLPGGGPPGDARTSYVPGTGTITKMEVKSGPTPAPLRVTVLSQLSTPGGGQGICCFYETETQLFTMTPNAITTVPLNIPVVDDVFGQNRVTYAVGVSAASGAGDLPVAQVGNTNVLATPTFGNPAVGWFYPRLGPQDGTNTGGRHEDGMPGIELLVRWTWVGAAATNSPASTAPLTPAVPGQTTVPRSTVNLDQANAKVKSNNALVNLICNGDAICVGQLALSNPGATVAATSKKTTFYSKKVKYSIPAGKKQIIKVKLNSKARRLLKKKKKLKVGLQVTPTGGKTTLSELTLKK